jgi:ATP-dependent RNA helicase RhlE
VCAAALHGNKSQGARTRALDAFRTAQTPVLVATDLAARGLDVDDITQVINYDLTSDPDTYVHRVGRTGRAGASGTAVSFCTAQERGNLRAIEQLLRAQLEHAAVPPLDGESMRQKPRPTPAVLSVSMTPERARRILTTHCQATRKRSPTGAPVRRDRSEPIVSAKP